MMFDWLKALETVAIVCNLAGVLLLFRYGMPYRVATPDGKQPLRWLVNDEIDPETVRLDRFYSRLGKLGLFLVVISNLILVALVWLDRSSNSRTSQSHGEAPQGAFFHFSTHSPKIRTTPPQPHPARRCGHPTAAASNPMPAPAFPHHQRLGAGQVVAASIGVDVHQLAGGSGVPARSCSTTPPQIASASSGCAFDSA